MFESLSLRDYLANKISKKNEPLSEAEQDLLKKELKFAKLKLVSQKIMVFFFIFIELIFFAYIAVRMTTAFMEAGMIEAVPNEDHIAVLTLDKAITDDYADQFISKLITINKNDDVKAIILRLRSPGGTPSASWNIADTMKHIQEENGNKKPLFVYIDSMAASGAYMIASQSNYIYANRFAVVGSIGVIMEHLVFEGLAKKVGIGEETLTAGEFKKVFSTFSYMDEKQKNRVQKEILDVMYSGFKDVVKEGRHLNDETLDKYAEGRIYIANDKKVEGILVDKVVDWTTFKDIVKEKIGKKGEDILFNRYKVLEDASFSKAIFGSALNLNLNLDSLKTNSNLGAIK